MTRHLLAADLAVDFLPERALWLAASRSLVLADLHLGKSATFRHHGLPIPEGDDARDLARLLDLARRLDAAEILVAGDLFHAPAGITPELEETLATFLHALDRPFHLVAGNHDTRLKHLPCHLRAEPSLRRGPFRIVHDPAQAAPPDPGDPDSPALVLAGHWHPAVTLRQSRAGRLTLPAFLLRAGILVLPAFGSFTGKARIQAQPGDRWFAPFRHEVIELPRELLPP